MATEETYKKMQLPDLKALIKERHIRGTSTMRKPQLIEVLLNYDAKQQLAGQPEETRETTEEPKAEVGEAEKPQETVQKKEPEENHYRKQPRQKYQSKEPEERNNRGENRGRQNRYNKSDNRRNYQNNRKNNNYQQRQNQQPQENQNHAEATSDTIAGEVITEAP